MPKARPSRKELAFLASRNHFELSSEELRVFEPEIANILETYVRLDKMVHSDKSLASRKGRRGRASTPEENPFGAWAWKCSIRKRVSRRITPKLLRKRIVIKDNVAVAGVPLQNGSQLMQGFVSSVDATIVSRILDEGGEIVGKSTCENLCVSGGSHTSYPRPVKNPRNPDYMAGGSSSGSAALLATGEVDMAIGGDQAGSIRIPASWCGVFGLKPTWGLVPYSGVIGMDPILDHVGPMANTTRDVALLLEAIAGRDGSDPRQLNTPSDLPRYSGSLRKSVKGMRIGVVKEGFGWQGVSEKDVDDLVRESAYRFQELGARVREITIPEHRDGIDIWTAIVMEGTWYHMIRDHGLEHHWSGELDIGLIEHWATAVRDSGNKLSETAKLICLVGNYVADRYQGKYYSVARNLRRRLIKAYDSALEENDLLVMPTTPQKAQRFKDMSLKESIDLSIINLHNTCAFDVSGHPALSVPCGDIGGLPAGMMIVGRYFDECAVLRASSAFEREMKRK